MQQFGIQREHLFCSDARPEESGQRWLTFLRGGVQVLQKVAAEHLLFAAHFSPDSPHLVLSLRSDSLR